MQKHRLAVALAIAAGTLVAASAAAADSQPVALGGWAVVSENGGLQNGLNVRTVLHPGRGIYHVKFNQDVSTCAATATIRGEKSAIIPGYVVVSNFNSNKVQVNTFDAATLLPTDMRFNMVVNC